MRNFHDTPNTTRMRLVLRTSSSNNCWTVGLVVVVVVGMLVLMSTLFLESRSFGIVNRRETTMTYNMLQSQPQPQLQSTQSNAIWWRQDVAQVANHSVAYRFPPQRFAALDAQPDKQLLVGVLSSSANVRHRTIIRKMWAHHHGNVFFIVGGAWTEIENEFETFGDLIWIDREESYREVVWKTMLLFVVAQRHIRNYRHILKTDDDSYVRIGKLEDLSAGKHERSDYWGWCNSNIPVVRTEHHKWHVSQEAFAPERYPRYAMGDGYLISSRFAKCLAREVATKALIPVEDAFTGIMADLCRVQCVTEPSISTRQRKTDLTAGSNEFALEHKIKPMGMVGLHYFTCIDDYRYREKSCQATTLLDGTSSVALPI